MELYLNSSNLFLFHEHPSITIVNVENLLRFPRWLRGTPTLFVNPQTIISGVNEIYQYLGYQAPSGQQQPGQQQQQPGQQPGLPQQPPPDDDLMYSTRDAVLGFVLEDDLSHPPTTSTAYSDEKMSGEAMAKYMKQRDDAVKNVVQGDGRDLFNGSTTW